MSERTDKSWIFRALDQLFWIVWFLFPVMIWVTFRSMLSENAIITDIGRVSAACANMIPQVGKFSPSGKNVVFIYLIFNFLVYGVLLAIAHITIHRFAKGKVFVEHSLKALGQLGLIIVFWPILDIITSNLMALFLFKVTGDVTAFEPNFVFDIAPFGIGLLILTIRVALQHAIALKQDQDLTI